MGLLSVIIPAYNEEKNIDRTSKKISDLLVKNNINYEILFINDGSKDETWVEILKACDRDENIQGINFSRNFGKESAIFAGLEISRGDCCAVIDCDLQHPPEKLVEMYSLWKQGYEVVEGVKKSRGKEGNLYKGFSKLFYKIISSLSGIDMHNASDYKLLDRKAVNVLINIKEKHLFFRALSSWIGFKSIQIYYDVNDREIGETKWTPIKLIKYAISNITSFSTAPMQAVTIFGVLFLIFSIGLGIQSLYYNFIGKAKEGFTTVIMLLLIIGSIIMISLGIIGYYISKIYEEIKGRPNYIISNIVNKK